MGQIRQSRGQTTPTTCPRRVKRIEREVVDVAREQRFSARTLLDPAAQRGVFPHPRDGRKGSVEEAASGQDGRYAGREEVSPCRRSLAAPLDQPQSARIDRFGAQGHPGQPDDHQRHEIAQIET